MELEWFKNLYRGMFPPAPRDSLSGKEVWGHKSRHKSPHFSKAYLFSGVVS